MLEKHYSWNNPHAKKLGFAWLEYYCTKCSELHRIRYDLIKCDLKLHGIQKECCMIRDQICVHKNTVYIDYFNPKRLQELLTRYAISFLTADPEKIQVKFELEK
jgi:hypothetical protein